VPYLFSPDPIRKGRPDFLQVPTEECKENAEPAFARLRSGRSPTSNTEYVRRFFHWASAHHYLERNRAQKPTGIVEIVGYYLRVLYIRRCSRRSLLFKTTPNNGEEHDCNDSKSSQEGFMKINLTCHCQLCGAGCVSLVESSPARRAFLRLFPQIYRQTNRHRRTGRGDQRFRLSRCVE
jgi:hypothetical protein